MDQAERGVVMAGHSSKTYTKDTLEIQNDISTREDGTPE